MMADLVRDHVGLREIARRMEAPFHLLVEGKVDVDGAVERAVERTHRGLAHPTSGPRRALEHHQFRPMVSATRRLEDALPDILRIGQHLAHEAGLLVVGRTDGILAARQPGNIALTWTRARHVRDLDAAARQERQRIDAKHQADGANDQQRRNADAAAADRDRDAHAPAREHAAALATPILEAVTLPVLLVVAHALVLDSWREGAKPSRRRGAGPPDPQDTAVGPKAGRPSHT